MWNMGVVKAFDSSGRLVRVLETPGRRPTNCAFDPHGRLGLVVTVADTGCVLSCPDIAQTRSGSRDETEVTLANRG